MTTKTLLIVLALVAAVVALVLMHGAGSDMSIGPLHVRVAH